MKSLSVANIINWILLMTTCIRHFTELICCKGVDKLLQRNSFLQLPTPRFKWFNNLYDASGRFNMSYCVNIWSCTAPCTVLWTLLNSDISGCTIWPKDKQPYNSWYCPPYFECLLCVLQYMTYIFIRLNPYNNSVIQTLFLIVCMRTLMLRGVKRKLARGAFD